MPDFIFKSTMFFQGVVHGYSETWWQLQSATIANYQNAWDNLARLATRRATLLGQECSITELRVSLETVSGDSLLLPAPALQSTGQPAADPNVGVLLTARSVNNTRRHNSWLKGFPDAIETNNGEYLKNTPVWRQAMDRYLGMLSDPAAGWGWYGTNPTAVRRAGLTNYTIGAGNQVIFNLAADVFSPELFGFNTQVRLKGVNGNSKLNGVQTVTVVDARTCYTYLPIAAVPWTFGGRLSWSPKIFYPIQRIDDIKTSERKSGAPFFLSRGRAKARRRV